MGSHGGHVSFAWLALMGCEIEGRFTGLGSTDGLSSTVTTCADRDEDGVCNRDDNCPDEANRAQKDEDGDLVGDVCDNCSDARNADQDDGDGDLVGDACDNCRSMANASQANADGDDKGDVCEPTDFTVWFDSAEIVPVKANENPWDWDGEVPDWLLTAGELLAAFTASPKIDIFAEILDYTDQIAPELLEGTIPPDAQLWPYLLDVHGDVAVVYEESVDDPNTVVPRWDYGVAASPRVGELLCVEAWDADLVDDDYIGGVCFDRENLQWLESLGPLRIGWEDAELGQLYSVTVEIYPF